MLNIYLIYKLIFIIFSIFVFNRISKVIMIDTFAWLTLSQVISYIANTEQDEL